jgi:hypothetical protein
MLINPFTPSEIASAPDDFFGRTHELQTVCRSLLQGSVAIEGAIGIGKSSLLARVRLLMEGFMSEDNAKSVVAVGEKGIETADDAARLILEQFVTIDQKEESVTFKLGSLFEKKSSQICRSFVTGRHLEALKRIVERESLDTLLPRNAFLLLAVDEADKCPVPLARLIRSVVTHTQHGGVNRVRFIVAGVSPFFQKMVDEDPGVNRFFYKTISLEPMPLEDAAELLEVKFALVTEQAEREGLEVQVQPEVIARIAVLSGGHPHILQLLGSHVIEHENEDPDGELDSNDLANSLRRVCYEDRARVYDSTLHMLELEGKLEALDEIIHRSARGFPTRMGRGLATELVGKESIRWLVEHNILSQASDLEYGLIDEFLRVRLLLDSAQAAESLPERALEERRLEKEILQSVNVAEMVESDVAFEEDENVSR